MNDEHQPKKEAAPLCFQFRPTPSQTVQSEDAQQDEKLNFDDIGEIDRAFFLEGLSADRQTLSLCCYEDGTSPSLEVIKVFLRQNHCVTSLKLCGAVLEEQEFESLMVGNVTTVTNPGVSDFSSYYGSRMPQIG